MIVETIQYHECACMYVCSCMHTIQFGNDHQLLFYHLRNRQMGYILKIQFLRFLFIL